MATSPCPCETLFNESRWSPAKLFVLVSLGSLMVVGVFVFGLVAWQLSRSTQPPRSSETASSVGSDRSPIRNRRANRRSANTENQDASVASSTTSSTTPSATPTPTPDTTQADDRALSNEAREDLASRYPVAERQVGRREGLYGFSESNQFRMEYELAVGDGADREVRSGTVSFSIRDRSVHSIELRQAGTLNRPANELDYLIDFSDISKVDLQLNARRRIGTITVSPFGELLDYTGETSTSWLMDEPAAFAFVPLRLAVDQAEWTIVQDTEVQVVGVTRHLHPAIEDYYNRMSTRSLRGPPDRGQRMVELRNLPAKTQDRYQLVQKNDESALIRGHRSFIASAGTERFELTGEELIGYDRTRLMVAKRLFRGSLIITNTGESIRLPIEYEMELTKAPGVRIEAIVLVDEASRRKTAPPELVNPNLPSHQVRLLPSPQALCAPPSLSPDGRWMARWVDGNLQLHDLNAVRPRLVKTFEAGTQLVAWDADSLGLVQWLADQEIRRVQWDAEGETSEMRIKIEVPTNFPTVQAVAWDHTTQELLLFGKLSVAQCDGESGKQRWASSSRSFATPTAIQFTPQHVLVDYPEATAKFSRESGELISNRRWSREARDATRNAEARELGNSRALFGSEGALVWRTVGNGPGAFAIESDQQLLVPTELSGVTKIAVADQGNLVIGLAKNRLILFDLTELKVLGSAELPSQVPPIMEILVSRAGNRIVLVPNQNDAELWLIDLQL